ncbi:hypothetical protein [Nonomuraea salmonea]|uniref:hypothetical protein n=1 Tax=Nonomuraea salmonea TaxID=46181 RepID=UPI002FEA01EB
MAAVEVDGLLALTAELVDSRLGVLGMLEEGALVQSPVAVCRAVVSDPLGVLPGWAPAREAFGWGADQRTARLRCLLAALATYGVLALRTEGEGSVRGWPCPMVCPAACASPAFAPYRTGRGRRSGPVPG